MPSAAKVAYAAAMVSGAISCEPSVMEGRGRMASVASVMPSERPPFSPRVTSAPCTPRSSAIDFTAQTPTWDSSRTKPVLTDW